MKTTPAKILALRPCKEWRKKLEAMPVDEVLDTSNLFDLNALMWVGARFAPNDLRMWSADCAARALPIWLAWRPNDDRPRAAILAARLNKNNAAAQLAYAAVDEAVNVHAAAVSVAALAAASAAASAACAAAENAEACVACAAGAAVHSVYAVSLAARAAEHEWQLKRLQQWLSDTPPEPIPV